MSFVVKNKLTRHEAIHSTERPHVCEICAKAFKHIDAFKAHMRRHNGTAKKNHVCSECGKAFYHKYDMEIHFRTHTGVVSLEN